MKKQYIYSALGGGCIGVAAMLLATDLITGLVAGVLITSGILFAIHAYK